MAVQNQDDQHEDTFSNYVKIRDEGQGYPCYQHDMMMITVHKNIKYMICKHILLNKPELIFGTQLKVLPCKSKHLTAVICLHTFK